jgi:hypothetical protein
MRRLLWIAVAALPLISIGGCVGLYPASVIVIGKVEGSDETLTGFVQRVDGSSLIGLISTTGAQCQARLVRDEIPGKRAFHRPFPPPTYGDLKGRISCDDGRYGDLRPDEPIRTGDFPRSVYIGDLAGHPLRLEQPASRR